MHGGELTHPGYASLADPHFACGGKRVKIVKQNMFFNYGHAIKSIIYGTFNG
jgi:hypothetical protein